MSRRQPKKPCKACDDIAASGLSYQDHTCDTPRATAPRGAGDALSGGRP